MGRESEGQVSDQRKGAKLAKAYLPTQGAAHLSRVKGVGGIHARTTKAPGKRESEYIARKKARYTRAAVRIETKLDIQAQPDDRSCGPTCLYSLYRYYGEKDATLKQTIGQIHSLDSGGTLAEILACHALLRGFSATIYTYHLQMFDPSWFADDGHMHDAGDLMARLDEQVRAKPWDKRLRPATKAFKEFLSLGGKLKMVDLTAGLIRQHLMQGIPIVAGLSSTYLYGASREFGPKDESDDIKGEPQGHFVMLVGYDTVKREVLVADPLDQNPPFHTAKYRLSVNRLINAVLLGIVTYDANLLVIEPGPGMKVPKPPVITEEEAGEAVASVPVASEAKVVAKPVKSMKAVKPVIAAKQVKAVKAAKQVKAVDQAKPMKAAKRVPTVQSSTKLDHPVARKAKRAAARKNAERLVEDEGSLRGSHKMKK